MEERLRTSLREKDVLLKEVHHRVKNNLAITASLLNFQIRKASNPEVVETLRQAQNRVGSMAMVHELLYHSESLAGIDLPEYVKKLPRQLLISYDVASRIKLEVGVPPMELLLDLAIPFGLVLNELVSNACKHAYPNRGCGRISISVTREPGGVVRLVVADDGVGLPAGVDPFSTSSLGLRLVRDLTQQLGGTLEVTTSPGTAFHVRFPALGSNA
jgi:two-component sensor histidine kinase